MMLMITVMMFDNIIITMNHHQMIDYNNDNDTKQIK